MPSIMKSFASFCLFTVASGFFCISCDKVTPEEWFYLGKSGRDIRLNVLQASDYTETKAENVIRLNNVFGSEDDDFVIEEYVSDIDATVPDTKGWEITTANIGEKYGAFNVMAFLDTLDKDKKTVHVNEFNLTSKRTSNTRPWQWDGYGVNDGPKWRTSTPTTIWSYAPISLGLTSDGNVTDGLEGWRDGKYTKLSFSHTVPRALSDQKDLLFAYNVEERQFQTDAQGNYPIDPVTKKPIFNFVAGQDENVDIHFHHALAAVKFELGPNMTGVDVHSITLCYTSSDASGNVSILGGGLATSGDCIVMGGALTFEWNNLGNNKPLYYEFAGNQSVASGYTSTQEGVLFMIPQSASNLSVIVEFSKNGSQTYITRLVNIPTINWESGKFYLYKLTGEIHVPGELLCGRVNLTAQHFASTPAANLWSTNFTQKGIKKVGVIVDGYQWGGNQSGSLWLFVSNGQAVNRVPASQPFSFNFLDTDIPNNPNTQNIYHFGLNGPSEENYDTRYVYTTSTSKTQTRYFVFDVEGVRPFNIQMYTTSGNNGASFTAPVRCMIVLETENAKLPTNWKTIVNQ